MPRTKKTEISASDKPKHSRFVFFRRSYRSTTAFVRRRPIASFATLFGLLLLVLIVGKLAQGNKVSQPPQPPIKNVTVFSIGESPKATFQAKIEKSGVVKIMAQTSGVVQSINVKAGDSVDQGQQLVSLASNYQGGNAQSVQRQIAQAQYQNQLDTYDQQKDLIQKQRDVANKTADNAQQQQQIAQDSENDTNSLINATQSQIDQMNQQLQTLQSAAAANPQPSQSTNGQGTTTTPQEQAASLQASINQAQGGLNQLRASQRSLDLQANPSNPPAQLVTLQQNISLEQLDVQQKSLDLSKEVSRLQLNLAYVNEATMFPATPFAGVVERVYVKEGDLVNPGTPIATVTSNNTATTAVLNVPETIARGIKTGDPSEIMIDNKPVAVTPYYISSSATDGLLYSVFYDIPDDEQGTISDQEYVTINVPISTRKTTASDPFVPVDAVYQTQENAYVLVAANRKAVTKTVTLGQVFGNYVEVLNGLSSGDQIILDRNVIAGDKVKISN